MPACNKRGGSIASENVIKAVDNAAFAKLNTYFDNAVLSGGSAWKKCSKCSKLQCKCGGKSKKCSKRGGSRVAYNYDGMLLERPLSNSTHNPSAATPLPFRTVYNGGNMKKLSELSNSSSYKLRNKVGGGSEENVTFPIGIDYSAAIKTSSIPEGINQRGVLSIASPLDSLVNMNPSSVPAPMEKVVHFGNNLTDDIPPAFSYGAAQPGGGLIKKMIVAAAARHVAKKAIKAYKKKKVEKSEKATSPTKSSPPTSKKTASSKTVKKSAKK